MNLQTKSILLKFDEKGQFETPSNFDYEALKSRVTLLGCDLKNHFRFDFTIDDQIQDASFFCDIKMPNELVVKPRQDLGYSIRISNFGFLATINFQSEYLVTAISDIKEILRSNGFQYLDSDEIDEIYDGQFEEFKNIGGDYPTTWFLRYFDYL